MKLFYHPHFVKQYAKLEKDLRLVVKEKIALLMDSSNYKILKVHKLHGEMKNQYSFSVDYRTRIVFEYLDKSSIVLLAIGDHDLYQ